MNIFEDINTSFTESEKVCLRQNIARKFRSKGTTPLLANTPFFAPLLFDIDRVGQKNCENLIGQVCIPVGIAGPVSILLKIGKNKFKLTDLLIPLATTEGALIASVNRGCKILEQAKNVQVSIKNVGMSRAPVFETKNTNQATKLLFWIKSNLRILGSIGESTSSHLTFLSCQLFQKNNLVFARFNFDTSEAMGMNMVTIATEAIAEYIIKHNSKTTCPALSSNVCADKKTSSLNRRLGRGRWVTVSSYLPTDLIGSILKTTPSALLATYEAKIVIGSQIAGLSGRNMQVANIAAAILAATGQDIAHTVDISQGTLTLKSHKVGILAKLSLPTVPVGTVGGGTSLQTQQTARNLISQNVVTCDILAATIGLAALAGELSGLSALSTNTLASSHKRLAR